MLMDAGAGSGFDSCLAGCSVARGGLRLGFWWVVNRGMMRAWMELKREDGGEEDGEVGDQSSVMVFSSVFFFCLILFLPI